MGSFVGNLMAKVSGPIATVFHGEDVFRWPGGVEENAELVEGAIWQQADEMNDGSINPQETYSGTLSILDDVEITEASDPQNADKWMVNGQVYDVLKTCDIDPASGRRELKLVRVKRVRTRNVKGAVTLVKGVR